MGSKGIPSKFKTLMKGNGSSNKELLLTGLAELIGTGILVFLGCMGCIASLGVQPSHLQITINFGLVVMIVIQCFGHISHAHINPAITIGAVVLGKKSIREALVYLGAQSMGAVLGYGLLKVVTPEKRLTSDGDEGLSSFCVTAIHPNVSPVQGLLIEGVATAILMLIACAVWDSRNAKNTDSVPLKFGLGVACLAIGVGPYTGCSLNPARSLGPAIWTNNWTNHWLYWFGPMGGSLLASLAYKSIFSPKNDGNEDNILPESLALNCADPEKAEH